MKKITILIPTYNERENIPSLYTAVKKEIQIHKEKYTFDYLFVDDGSTDDTVDILEVLAKKDKKVKLVELSRNCSLGRGKARHSSVVSKRWVWP